MSNRTAQPMARSTRLEAVRTAGFRSVEAVRVVHGPSGSFAEVTGVLHRYPQTVRVSLATATRLAAAGCPLSVTHRSEPEAVAG